MYETGETRWLKVAVVAEDPLARGALVRILGESREVKLVAEGAPSGPLAVVLPKDLDVVVWDAGVRADGMPSALSEDTDAPVVALVPDEASAGLALAAGARGVLFRDADASIIVPALRAVAANLVVLEPELAPSPASALGPGSTDFTRREREVLGLLAEGLSNRLIAGRLGISEHTAKFHVNALLEKLHASTRTEAVVKAARTGVLVL
jgi:DNA-binding NarL/FixJ family response regulator